MEKKKEAKMRIFMVFVWIMIGINVTSFFACNQKSDNVSDNKNKAQEDSMLEAKILIEYTNMRKDEADQLAMEFGGKTMDTFSFLSVSTKKIDVSRPSNDPNTFIKPVDK